MMSSLKQLLYRTSTHNFFKLIQNNNNSQTRYLGMVDSFSKTNGSGKELRRTYNWHPETIFAQPYRAGQGHGCLVLNREIKIPPHVVNELWENASIRCCIDGGSNRWRHFLTSQIDNERSLKLPDLITGDFDSITAETNEYFADKSIKRIHTPDQNATDFSKAVDVVKPLLKNEQLHDIIVFHDTSGRFDQIMANINTLYTRHDDHFNIYLLSGCSLTWLLKPGKHSIVIPAHLVEEQRWCSLIPIGQEATNVTTTGLKWNLTHGSMFFGGLVSTSNTYASSSSSVEVETDTTLIWSMGVFSFGDD